MVELAITAVIFSFLAFLGVSLAVLLARHDDLKRGIDRTLDRRRDQNGSQDQ
jgi:hypothetical protein